jgi:histidine triad (HIT) family protein
MTIFEKIAAREIPAEIVHETEEFLAIRDARPQAPVHVLIIPKRHIARLSEVNGEADADLIGRMFCAAPEIARKCGVAQSGYRLVVNNGRDAGESVPHLHIHLLGGRAMHWPPG